VTELESPGAAPTSRGAEPQKPKSQISPSLLLTASLVALAFAVSTWLLASRQIADLRSELTNLQNAHRELALQMGQGRRGGSAAGQTIDIAGAPATGSAGALTTLIEYSDYECPFCVRHFQQTMPQIDEKYIKTGKIRYVFRDFPIAQNHPQAIRAHEAAQCAAEQGKFWEMHGRLFSAPGTHTPVALEDRAREAGLNADAYRACVASGRHTAEIRSHVSQVTAMGATGTPWFFVGIRDPKTEKVRILRSLGGAQPYEQFVVALDAALKESAAAN
jgi:protein-disulfide isomerase